MGTIFKNIEEILASISISITIFIVITNVILRYGFNFVVPWSEELSVICFTWAVYLGVSSCYKHKLHMGVDVILTFLPNTMLIPFRICILTFLLIINAVMAYLSYDYTMLSSKVTPVMGMSYFTINGVLVFSFSLMVIHTLVFLKDEILLLREKRVVTL